MKTRLAESLMSPARRHLRLSVMGGEPPGIGVKHASASGSRRGALMRERWARTRVLAGTRGQARTGPVLAIPGVIFASSPLISA